MVGLDKIDMQLVMVDAWSKALLMHVIQVGGARERLD
jgi:hypothetical protein